MLLKTSKSVKIAVADVAVIEEAVMADVAVIEVTLVVHVMVADTVEAVMVVHVTAVETKAQAHAIVEQAETHVLQEVMVYLEVTEAKAVILLQKKVVDLQVHVTVADTKATVIAVIADHHAHQEATNQVAHHVVIVLLNLLQETLTKKTNLLRWCEKSHHLASFILFHYALSNANLRPKIPNTLPAILSMYFFVRK